MNGLGTSKFVFAAHASMVLLPQFDARRYIEAIGRFGVTWLTSVPPCWPWPCASGRRSRKPICRPCARCAGLGAGHANLVDDVTAYFPRTTILIAYGTTEAGPSMFGPHPAVAPSPISPSVGRSRVSKCACRAGRRRARRALDPHAGEHDGISQPAGENERSAHAGWVVQIRATSFDGTRGRLLVRRPRRRHVRVRRREHLSG